MRTIQFNAANVDAFYAQVEEAKAQLVKLCERQLDDRVCMDISVARYNMSREELKQEFPLEVIGMLDASGFINEILCDAESTWLRVRKVRSLSPSQLQDYVAWETKKGGTK